MMIQHQENHYFLEFGNLVVESGHHLKEIANLLSAFVPASLAKLHEFAELTGAETMNFPVWTGEGAWAPF
jgi:hypothetical protein